MVAPCTAGGRAKGDATPVVAEFLPPAEHARVDRLMAEKYRIDRVLILPVYRFVLRLRGKRTDEGDSAYLALTST